MELNSLFWTPTLKILQIYHEQWIQLLEIILNTLKYSTWMTSSSSSSWLASVSWWHTPSMESVFHTLHRGQRYTIICPIISYIFLRCTFNFSWPRENPLLIPSVTLLPLPLPPSLLMLPTPHQVYSCLFPPPHTYSRPQTPFSTQQTGLIVITYRCTL